MKLQKLFPITITDKITECRDFYTKVFSFEVVFEAEWYIHMRHESGTELAVMLPNLENQPSIIHKQYFGEGVIYSFEVEDARKEYERIKKLGADICFDLKDEEWGQRHFMLKDPSGMVIDIVQHL
jgi:uncharacterized glyoxalase superfamily protein PhnB